MARLGLAWGESVLSDLRREARAVVAAERPRIRLVARELVRYRSLSGREVGELLQE